MLHCTSYVLRSIQKYKFKRGHSHRRKSQREAEKHIHSGETNVTMMWINYVQQHEFHKDITHINKETSTNFS